MVLVGILLGVLVTCLATAVLGQAVGPRAGWLASAGLAAAAVSLSVTPTSSQPTAVLDWLPGLGIRLALGMDGLGRLFGVIVLVIGTLVMAYAAGYLGPGAHGMFYGLLSFFPAAMLLLVLAQDVVVLWVAWELTTLCSFLLLAQTGPRGRGPALRTFVVTGAGGLMLLAAVCLMWATTGTTTMADVLSSPAWQSSPTRLTVTAVLVALAAFTKAAQLPFHAWLPDAMVASTPVSAYLHAAALVKAGVFVLLRFTPLFRGVPAWHGMLVAVGLATALAGAVMAMQRLDLKELLAYSTISQLGFIVATIGVGTVYAITAAVVHVAAHALFKSALFMSVGLIDHEAGTRDIRRVSGLARSMPVTSVLLAVSAASMAGVPPLFGFVSKEALFKGLASVDAPAPLTWIVIIVPVAAACLTVAYSARMLVTTLPGPAMSPEPHEAPVALWAPVGVAAGAGVVLGVSGPVLEGWVGAASAAVTGEVSEVDLSLWHGLSLPLVMSVIALAVGLCLVAARSQVDRLLVGRSLWWWRAVDVVDGFRAGTIRVGAQLGRPTRSDAPAWNLIPPLVAFSAIVLLSAGASGTAQVPASRPADWLAALLVLLGVAFTVRAPSRVALVTTVGVVGFALALMYFMLGAPDVALAQLLVETLTVAVMVMLLTRLPLAFHETTARRQVAAGSVALLAGAAGLVVALMVQAPSTSPALGTWFIEHAPEVTGGGNVVNTILVDFRALDTLGEMTALGVAGLALRIALVSRGLLPLARSERAGSEEGPVHDPVENTVTLRVVDRAVGPLLVVLAGWFYLRGHHAPGGGFVAALVAAAGVVLVYLSSSDDGLERLRVPSTVLVGTGIITSTVVGLAGLAGAGFLAPTSWTVGGLKISSVLVFDLGVFLTVLGLVTAAVAGLGTQGAAESAPVRRRGDVTVKEVR